MLRTIFVAALLIAGSGFALASPVYALGFYLWIAYFRPEAWAWSDAFQHLNLSYIAGLYLVGRSVFSSASFKFDGRIALLGLFLLHSLVSTLLSANLAWCLPYWEDFAKATIVTCLIAVLISDPSQLRLMLIVIALSLGFEGVKQGWAELVLHPGGANTNSVPFLGDNNCVAVGMLMLMGITIALAQTAGGLRERFFFHFMTVGLLYRAISTYSRGGFLAAAALGAIAFWRSPHKLRTVAAVVVVGAILVPVLPQAFWDRMSTITATDDARDESEVGRLHFWNVALRMAADQPILGVGHNGYQPAYNRYDTSDGRFSQSRSVHSAWFGVLAELGYVGLALFLVIIGLSFRACYTVRKRAARGDIPPELGRYAAGLEMGLVAFVVGGSFVPFQYVEMLWHFIGLTMALGAIAAAAAAAQPDALDSSPAMSPAAA